WADLGMVPAHVRVGEHDVGLGHPPDRDDLLAENHPLTGRQDEAARTASAGAFSHAGLRLEGAGVHPLVLDQLVLDRTQKLVTLVAGMFPSRVAQLAEQRVVDLGEVAVVLRAHLQGEVIGYDGASTNVDRPVVVHFAHQTATELDWTHTAS